MKNYMNYLIYLSPNLNLKEAQNITPPRVSFEIIKNIKLKHRTWRRFKKQGDEVSHEQFNRLRAETKVLINNAYNNYCIGVERDISVNPNKFWRFVNIKRNPSGIPTCLNYENTVISDQKSIANAFAKFFQSSLTLPDQEQYYSSNNISFNNFDINSFTEADVFKCLKKIKPKFTAGLDKIPAFLVKDCARILASPLYIVFNLVISTSTFPNLWKVSRIVPVFKKVIVQMFKITGQLQL